MGLLGKILLVFAIIAGLSSCGENTVSPTTSAGSIKSETKWMIDPSSIKPDVKVYNKIYDKSGNLIEFTEYDMSSGLKKSQSVYDYNQPDRSLETIQLFDKAGNTISKLITSRIYDANKKVKQTTTTNEQGAVTKKEEYSYDPQGNLAQKLIYSVSTNLPVAVNYSNVYDDKGFLIERSSTGADNAINKELISYKEGCVVVTDVDKSGAIQLVTSYVYKSGRIVSEELKDANKVIVQSYRYDYSYFK